jgi:hypothetical protein
MVAVGGTVAGTVVFATAGTLLVSWLITDYQPRILYSKLRKVRS